MAPQHPDPIERLRLALWGGADDRTRAAAAHAAACGACAVEARDLAAVRDLLRIVNGGEPSPGVRESIAAAVGVHAATLQSWADVTWLPAVAAGSAAGVRAADATDHVLRCDDGDLLLDVAMHQARDPGRWTLTGQVLVDGDSPGADLVVTLFLDRLPAAAAKTDKFGEFTLAARRAREVGVSVAGHGRPRHVELWRDGNPGSTGVSL